MDSESEKFNDFKLQARILTNLWHVGEPLEDSEDALKVIWHCGVCDSIIVHDLDPSQLVVGSIDFPAQNLHRNTNLLNLLNIYTTASDCF